jgi:hypothetical protein
LLTPLGPIVAFLYNPSNTEPPSLLRMGKN